ncbi:MAG: hypothetical protein CML81_01315 [Rhodobiaceae bacterium]|nr:hypothetical protein [Rhodobiaceae bacterium]RPF97691.1 MAG: hypothetical protein CBD87_001305 [Rhizobiales bacterium TMED227]|tara:strand:+ start:7721 stop:7945 length:225 start_codon:yes stop_codon:yes gene_type:complete
MSIKYKIEGYSNLQKDSRSGAIVNTNVSEYQLYMARRETRKSQADQIKNACREINSIKNELKEIRNLVLELVKK